MNETKQLPPMTAKEVWLSPDYIIARFMNTKTAYKTAQHPKGVILTIKPIQEQGLPEQIQVHLRFKGRDHWNGDKEQEIDIDIYIDKVEWLKVLKI